MKQIATDYWKAVLSRDKNSDGKFFYAVSSTKIFCRPSCASRRPKRQNVLFFKTAAEAQLAGFRACKRCNNQENIQQAKLVSLIKQVCMYIKSKEHCPSLQELSSQFQLSPSYLQKQFKHIIGASPKQFSDSLRRERFRKNLKSGQKIMTAIYNAGYESSSNVYGQNVQILGMIPSKYQKRQTINTIHYIVSLCPLGAVAIASTDEGICRILLDDTKSGAKEKILEEFPQALSAENPVLIKAVSQISQYLAGKYIDLDLPLDIKATAFQQRVWNALKSIPYGQTRSYQEIAKQIGNPSATRAVAQACANNKVALVVPCHRVIRSNGDLSGYRWGVKKKAALLSMEKSKDSK